MNILLGLGITLFFGTLGGKLFQRFKIPQVVGYICVGLFLSESFFNVWPAQVIDYFSPLVNLTLGIIGFMIGKELNLELFRKRGKSIYSILICETFITFITVTLLITLVTQKLYFGLIFGALAAATAPAATVDVLWEYKTRGPLTATLLAIVALDDVLALIIYGFASVFAKSMITKEHVSLFHSIEGPFTEIGISILIGATSGFIISRIIRWTKDKERILPFSLGLIILTVGASVFFKVDLILSSMIMGALLANLSPHESEEVVDALKKFSAPLYVFFFVLVGARIDLRIFTQTSLIMLILIYVFSRSLGKVSGAYLGGWIGGAQTTVKKFLGTCLFSQAGVAVGLAISIHQSLSHMGTEAAMIGSTVLSVVVASTFIVQLIGPSCVRWSVHKADEVWRDVTEDDIISSYKITDMMEKEPSVIREEESLHAIMEIVKESESYHFCVVDKNKKLLGVISLGDLRSVFHETELELSHLILAKDIVNPNFRTCFAYQPLKDAIDIFRRSELDFLPIVEDEETFRLVGVLDQKNVTMKIDETLLLRRGHS